MPPLLGAATSPDATSAMAEAAAGVLFRHEDLAAARDVLQGVRRRGVLEVTGLGQLAAIADRLGDHALRDAVVDELVPRDDLPPPVARIVISFLCERERHDAARRVAAGAVTRHPREATLWLELGRAELLLANEPAATAALERALAAGLPPETGRDAARLLHVARVPGLFAAMREVDAMLARGERVEALRAARGLVRRSEAAQSWLFLGIVRQRLLRERLAERALRRALAADNGLAEAHNRLGILLVGKGQLELGLGHLQRAERLSPDDPSPKLHLAQTCALLGRLGEGERLLDVAARLGANPATVAAIRQQFFAA